MNKQPLSATAANRIDRANGHDANPLMVHANIGRAYHEWKEYVGRTVTRENGDRAVLTGVDFDHYGVHLHVEDRSDRAYPVRYVWAADCCAVLPQLYFRSQGRKNGRTVYLADAEVERREPFTGAKTTRRLTIRLVRERDNKWRVDQLDVAVWVCADQGWASDTRKEAEKLARAYVARYALGS